MYVYIYYKIYMFVRETETLKHYESIVWPLQIPGNASMFSFIPLTSEKFFIFMSEDFAATNNTGKISGKVFIFYRMQGRNVNLRI